MSNLGVGLRSVDWANTKVERFEKNFYVEDKRVSARTEREIEEFKRVKEIKVNQACLIVYPTLTPMRSIRLKEGVFQDPSHLLMKLAFPTI